MSTTSFLSLCSTFPASAAERAFKPDSRWSQWPRHPQQQDASSFASAEETWYLGPRIPRRSPEVHSHRTHSDRDDLGSLEQLKGG